MPVLAEIRRQILRNLGRPVGWLLRRKAERFTRLCDNPEAVQTQLLLKIIRTQAPTVFGLDHRFSSIRTVADFRKHIPIAPYERLAPYIERVAQGETNALLANGPVRLLALTSGTTAARKLIPVTDDSLKAYREGWGMWGARMYNDHRTRRLFGRPMVQMIGDPVEYVTPAGVPCGNMSGYTAMVQKRIVRSLYALPYQTGKTKDPFAKYYTAVRLTIGRACSVFMAANPSTLVQFARTLDQSAISLLRDLHDGTLRTDLDLPSEVRKAVLPWLKADPARAKELTKIAEKNGTLYPKDVWPQESILIGCWTGGSMGAYLRQLPKYFGDAPVRDLGLIASEGRFSIPFANQTSSGVLDIAANYYEFVPEDEFDSAQPNVLGAHELTVGGVYYILPTTQAGLYRYHISDLVRVTGFLGRTPLIEFLSKGSRFANLTGEKLSEHHVTRAFDTVSAQLSYRIATAYSVAPVWDDRQPYYGLFVEDADAKVPTGFVSEFDSELGRNNIEYAAKRESGRLGPVRLHSLPAGFWSEWDRNALATRGGSPEQYKHPCLIGDLNFARKALGGQPIQTP
ncbi:MAG: GH3 auxin-responsive promoter family protein [Gemmataceae bacterium]